MNIQNVLLIKLHSVVHDLVSYFGTDVHPASIKLLGSSNHSEYISECKSTFFSHFGIEKVNKKY